MLPCFFMRSLLPSVLIVAVCLCGCGIPGAPQPPSLGIPKAVTDLSATRKGSIVMLTWSPPTETTDGELIRHPGKMAIARKGAAGGTFQPVAEVELQPSVKTVQRTKASVGDNIASLLAGSSTEFFIYQETTIGLRNRSSEPSNQVSIPAVLTATPPQSLTLGLAPRGVTVTFPVPAVPETNRLNSEYVFRVMRRQSDGNASAQPATVAEVKPGAPIGEVLDTRIEWEKKYDYWVTPITRWHSGAQQGEVQGDDSPTASILAHDTFAPAVPAGLQAVFSGVIERPGIDLTWSPNTDDDLAGYNVYRRANNGTPERINTELVKSPAFHDANVAPGNTYIYSVSAVDVRGNESARSAEASESVPKQ